MNEQYTYYSGTLEKTDDLEERLQNQSFTRNDSGTYQDRHNRMVIINANDSIVKIGIPKADLLDELEQLEFIVAILDLDIDSFQKTV